MRSFQKFLPFVFLQAMLLAAPLFAADETVNVRYSGAQITTGLSLRVQDDKFLFMQSQKNAWMNSFTNHQISNRIILSIDQTSNVYQGAAYTVNVELSVKYYTWNSITQAFVPNNVTPNPVLTVSYNPAGPYQDKYIYQLPVGGNQMDVKIENITPSVTGAIMNLALDCELQTKRFYKFNQNQFPAIGNNPLVSSRGELEVYWDFIPGAEEYELEWTHVNNYNEDGSPLDPALMPLDLNLFKFNSTRVNTFNNDYRIPLIYERGYILYRVRAVARSAADNYEKNLYGAWSSDNVVLSTVSQFNAKYLITGHEQNLNWQNSVSFAEEGKNKVAVSYFDGSLRNRQVVSKINSEDKTIVGETIYDHQGRGTVQVLPVPGTDPKVGYKPELNLNGAGQPYSKEDFDKDNNCTATPGSMSPVKGASNYYSDQNPDKTGANKYLPDAQGYPFTQVEYTPDNTGRIRKQSGVGIDHTLGSGHETRYFYGKPTLQSELDKLFGTEVGPMQRYKKNMVVDANGQVSVSYLDPQGRVIATALAGQAPDNLDSLDSPFVEVEGDLLNKTRSTDKDGDLQSIEGTSKKFRDEMLVTSKGYREFNYSLTGEKFFEECLLTGQKICYDCVLDLEIMLTDECSNHYLLGLDNVSSASTKDVIGQNILDAMRAGNFVAADCNGAPLSYTAPASWKKTKEPLEPGNYSITKVLTVNREALDFYTEEYLRTNDCLLSLDDFIAEELKNIDTLGCEMTCDECRQRLGDYEQYDVNVNPQCDPCLTEAEYLQQQIQCDQICEDGPVDCEAPYENMVTDVSPFGQYGGLVKDDGTFAPNYFRLSVFSSVSNEFGSANGNLLPRRLANYQHGSAEPTWRYPLLKVNGAYQNKYLDEMGNQAYVQVTYNEIQQKYLPEIMGGVTPVEIDEQMFVKPEQLRNVKDFVFAWNDSWGKSLVLYHPEYCYYEFCTQNEPSHSFDQVWLNTFTYNHANFNPLGADAAAAIDPYFSSDLTVNPLFEQDEYDAMKRSMDEYLSNSTGTYSIWQVSHAIVTCPSYNTTSGSCNAPNCLLDPVNPATFTDEEWKVFHRLYHSLKQKFYEQKATRYAIEHGCYNGCIGEKKFSYSTNNFWRYRYTRTRINGYSYWSRPVNDWEQPCNVHFYTLYSDKVKRFPRVNDAVGLDAMDATLCYDDASDGKYEKVNCPDKNLAVISDLEDKADFEFFQSCGQCPVTKDLETLLNAIAVNPDVTLNDEFQLSCYPNSEFPEFTPDLENAMALSGTGEVFWQPGIGNTRTLNVKINRRASIHSQPIVSSCDLQLQMENSYSFIDSSRGRGQNITVSKTFALSDILGFCCATYEPSTLYPNRAFSIFAKVAITYADGSNDTIQIPVHGHTSCIDVNPATCDKPLICQTTRDASHMQNLFNMLLMELDAYIEEDGSSIPAKPNQLITTSFTDPYVNLDPAIPPFDQVFIDSLIKYTGLAGTQLRWQADVQNSILTGWLKGLTGNQVSGQCLIELTLPVNMPAGAGFQNILSFAAIQADKDNITDPVNNFKIMALIEYMDGTTQKKKYVELKGYSPCIRIAECTEPVFTGQGN
jgi:hypothetical protein